MCQATRCYIHHCVLVKHHQGSFKDVVLPKQLTLWEDTLPGVTEVHSVAEQTTHLQADGCAGRGQPDRCDACRLHLVRPAGQDSVPRRLLAMRALPVETLRQCACPDWFADSLAATQPIARAAVLASPPWCSWMQHSTRAAYALQDCRGIQYMSDTFLGWHHLQQDLPAAHGAS